jgi:hypothetical protein
VKGQGGLGWGGAGRLRWGGQVSLLLGEDASHFSRGSVMEGQGGQGRKGARQRVGRC